MDKRACAGRHCAAAVADSWMLCSFLNKSIFLIGQFFACKQSLQIQIRAILHLLHLQLEYKAMFTMLQQPHCFA
eukprot:jgi/Chrzof1/6160/Cz17g13190.t1